MDLTGQDTLYPENLDKKTAPRLTYSQDWPAYNEAQTNEKLLFLQLLGELTAQIPKPERIGAGRPPADLGEMIFSCALKIYLGFSSRRTESDLKIAEHLGYLSHTPHYNTILKYLNKPELKAILVSLVEFSATPLKSLEEVFAADSTGFSTSNFSRWKECCKRKGEHRLYRKAHIMCGTRTNVITSVEITEGITSDFKVFPHLVESTAKRFQMKEVLADKGYSSRDCMEVVSNHGAIPFIAFRNNCKGRAKACQIWKSMYRFFIEYKEEYMRHYHMRSNVESTFSMMKRKQGTFLRSKGEIGQTNEILCKALVHNICVLIQEIYESGVKIDFEGIGEDELMCKILR
jgi:transposase